MREQRWTQPRAAWRRKQKHTTNRMERIMRMVQEKKELEWTKKEMSEQLRGRNGMKPKSAFGKEQRDNDTSSRKHGQLNEDNNSLTDASKPCGNLKKEEGMRSRKTSVLQAIRNQLCLMQRNTTKTTVPQAAKCILPDSIM